MKPFVLLPLLVCQSFAMVSFAAAAGRESPPSRHSSSTGRRLGASAAANDKRNATAVAPKGAREGHGVANQSESRGASGTRASKDKVKPSQAAAVSSVQTHRVKRGETIAHLASRYDTTGSVLAVLNGLEGGESLREGQFLFVPRQDKPASSPKVEQSNAVWRRYAKPPSAKGYLNLSTYAARFAGQALEKDGRLLPAAVRAINGVLSAGGKHPPVPERLIRLLVKVSDTFGGRSIHVVSGYRANSYYEDSRHRLSAAIDFAIAGVPNAVLCEYLREFDDVGVGYYPNSTFVHLDVRNHSAYWVDYSGPGERPRSTPNAPRRSRVSKRMLLAEIDALVRDTKRSIETAGATSTSSDESSDETISGSTTRLGKGQAEDAHERDGAPPSSSDPVAL